MPNFRSFTLIAGSALMALTACSSSSVKKYVEDNSHYWQRADATSAIYQRGPKAQQMLNRDISRCVTEIRELERLGAIRYATPADNTVQGETPDPDTPAGSLAQWESPDRDGALYAEHLEYHDFETCMMAKGWERVEYLPHDVAEESRADYIEAITGEKYRTHTRQRAQLMAEDEGDFDNLNE